MPRKTIPVITIDFITSSGIYISQYFSTDKISFISKEVHRDDHYTFIFQQTGNSQLMLDFNIVNITGPSVLCILPGQVHQVLSVSKVSAWFIAIKPEVIKDAVRHFFTDMASPANLVALNAEEESILTGLMDLQARIAGLYSDPDNREEVIGSLIHGCISMIVHKFKKIESAIDPIKSRAVIITGMFRKILSKFIKTKKEPSAYAEMLHISPSYLNEVVKKTTGFTVSYWIYQEMALEAKRMLSFTDASVKEIAAELGYGDQSYFTRIFTKVSGVAPIDFRRRYRKSS